MTAHTKFVDGQGWWNRSPGDNRGIDLGHLHIGGEFPTGPVSAPFDLPIRVVLHNNPSTFDYIAVVLKGAGLSDLKVATLRADRTGLRGSYDTTVEEWFTASVDPNLFPYSGQQEIRVRVFTTSPEGNSFISSITVPVHVATTKPKKDWTREPWTRGKGLYNSPMPDGTISKPYADATFVSPLPTKPVSGVWDFDVIFTNHPTGHTNNEVVAHRLLLDSNAHAGIPGTALLDGTGPLPADGVMAPHRVSLDTRKLANGTHRLFGQIDTLDPRGPVLQGSFAFAFDVYNEPPPPDPAPAPAPAPALTFNADGVAASGVSATVGSDGLRGGYTITTNKPITFADLQLKITSDADGSRWDFIRRPGVTVNGEQVFTGIRSMPPAGSYTARVTYTLDGSTWRHPGPVVRFTV